MSMNTVVKLARRPQGHVQREDFTITQEPLAELKDGEIKEFEVSPADFGLPSSSDSITGGDAAENAGVARRILSGEETGVKRDVVLANAGTALYLAGKTATIQDGVNMARESIGSGAALKKLDALREFTQNLTA